MAAPRRLAPPVIRIGFMAPGILTVPASCQSKEGTASFYEQKKQKTFLNWAVLVATPRAQTRKKRLFKKRPLSLKHVPQPVIGGRPQKSRPAESPASGKTRMRNAGKSVEPFSVAGDRLGGEFAGKPGQGPAMA